VSIARNSSAGNTAQRLSLEERAIRVVADTVARATHGVAPTEIFLSIEPSLLVSTTKQSKGRPPKKSAPDLSGDCRLSRQHRHHFGGAFVAVEQLREPSVLRQHFTHFATFDYFTIVENIDHIEHVEEVEFVQ